MNTCRVCGGPASNDGDRLCNHCREMEFKAKRFIQENPELARRFFRDLVIKAGQSLRAETKHI